MAEDGRRRARLALGGLCVLLAAGLALVARQEIVRSASTEPVAVARTAIPPYTLVTPDQLVLRELPRLRDDQFPIYRQAQDVAGLITVQAVPAGGLLYRAFFSTPRAYRLTDDAALEVVSFPVRPEKAVGGAVRPGMRVNIYRIAVAGARGTSLERALAEPGAAVELLAGGVEVRDTPGVGRGLGAAVGSELAGAAAAAGSSVTALQILTVAVPPQQAAEIIRLVAESRVGYDYWVTLAPVR